MSSPGRDLVLTVVLLGAIVVIAVWLIMEAVQ